MTVQAIRLQNFMAFEDTGWIKLRPITLLFGTNSSGKSAIIRALRLLKQSLMNPSETDPFVYALEDSVDVGSFPEMVHQYDIGRAVSFGFRCQISPILLSYLVGVERQYTPIPEQEAWSNFVLSFSWDSEKQNAELLSIEIEASWSAHPELNKQTIFGAERVKGPNNEEDEWYFWSDFLQEYESDTSDNIWPATRIGVRKGFLPWLDVQSVLEGSRGYPEEAWGGDFDFIFRMLSEFETSIEQFLTGLAYTPPIRPDPQRFYILKENEQRRWRQRGMKEYLRFILGETTKAEQQIADTLFRVELGEHLQAEVKYQRSDGRGKLTEIWLDEIDESGVHVNIIDVGFGLSQVIPVIVQSVLSAPGSLVMIEQPELHLHPGAQARLADVFIESTLSNKSVFLLETHSEHLLLRVQTRIAETENKAPEQPLKLKCDDVKFYFVNRKKGCSFIDELPIRKTGYLDLSEAPPEYDDFFADNLLESLALSEAAHHLEESEYEPDS